MVLLNASNRRISKRPICFNLAPLKAAGHASRSGAV
jgi:hypothetical protein